MRGGSGRRVGRAGSKGEGGRCAGVDQTACPIVWPISARKGAGSALRRGSVRLEEDEDDDDADEDDDDEGRGGGLDREARLVLDDADERGGVGGEMLTGGGGGVQDGRLDEPLRGVANGCARPEPSALGRLVKNFWDGRFGVGELADQRLVLGAAGRLGVPAVVDIDVGRACESGDRGWCPRVPQRPGDEGKLSDGEDGPADGGGVNIHGVRLRSHVGCG